MYVDVDRHENANGRNPSASTTFYSLLFSNLSYFAEALQLYTPYQVLFFFFLRIRRPPRSTLFPSPPLSRSAVPCAGCVPAGAASDPLRVPSGTPLAGYGSMKRRLLLPDVFDRHAHAFWFKPSIGERDPLMTRALVLEAGATRLAWVTPDPIAADPAFVGLVPDPLPPSGGPTPAPVLLA